MNKVCFFILILFISCKNESDFKNSKKLTKEDFRYKISLTDSIFAPVIDNVSSKTFTYKLFQDSLFYFIYNNNKLALLNINKEKISKITIPEYEITGGIVSIEAINTDSIFLLQNFPPKLILLTKNKTGDFAVTEKASLNKLNLQSTNKVFINETLEYGDEYNFNVDRNNLFYDTKKALLHIGIEPFSSATEIGFENTHRIGVYDWKEKKWKFSYASPYGRYKQRGSKTFGRSFLSSKQFFVNNDTTFLSYKIDENIVLFNSNTGKKLRLQKFSYKYANDFFPPMSLKESKDIERTKEYINTVPYYFHFFYHPKLKLYSRIYLDQQPLYNSKGKLSTFADREVYITLFNKKFQQVGVEKLEKNMFSYNIIPTSDGFLMFSNKYTDRDTLDNFFKLKYKYVIQQK